jgi:hypothetical protein
VPTSSSMARDHFLVIINRRIRPNRGHYRLLQYTKEKPQTTGAAVFYADDTLGESHSSSHRHVSNQKSHTIHYSNQVSPQMTPSWQTGSSVQPCHLPKPLSQLFNSISKILNTYSSVWTLNGAYGDPGSRL